MAEKTIQQPDDKLQEKLNELIGAKPEEVCIGDSKKKYLIGWLHFGTIRKFSDISVSEKNPHKMNVKLATVVLLNNKFKIMFFYWIMWRWLYYFKDMDDVEILAILTAAKKKIQQEAFFLLTMFTTEMTDLMMTMTKMEVSAIRAAQRGEQPSV